ncbi:MAG: ATP-dependent metallopeptidase FtsH/Yme1/Tma family protein, partial [Desulfobacteraceae bacterium]|nr:ATP-dependent metallopeptidase FtsH/Yme1/Tma family protein [Desulfobacteraceae bacterium]
MKPQHDENGRPPGNGQDRRQPKYPWSSPQENNFQLWVLLAVILVFLGWSMFLSRAGPEKVKYTTFLRQLNEDNVAEVTIKGDKITGSLREKAHKPAQSKADAGGVGAEGVSGQNSDKQEGTPQGTAYTHFVTYLPSFGDPDLMDVLQSREVPVQTEPKSDTNWWYLILTFLPFVILIWL